MAHDITIELKWPEHPVFPNHGFVVRRRDLDQFVAEHAEKAGATLHQGTEALQPILRDGMVAGAVVKDKDGGDTREIHARYVVIADGSQLTVRPGPRHGPQPELPAGHGHPRPTTRARCTPSPWIESALDVRDRNGRSLPGYGWIFPVGDGTINVGIGLLSTFKDFKNVNTSHLMAEWAATAPGLLGASTPTSRCCAPTGGRIPMAGSVEPEGGADLGGGG